VYRIKKLKKRQGPKGCRAIERERERERERKKEICVSLELQVIARVIYSNVQSNKRV
jgi:hypothetical protein